MNPQDLLIDVNNIDIASPVAQQVQDAADRGYITNEHDNTLIGGAIDSFQSNVYSMGAGFVGLVGLGAQAAGRATGSDTLEWLGNGVMGGSNWLNQRAIANAYQASPEEQEEFDNASLLGKVGMTLTNGARLGDTIGQSLGAFAPFLLGGVGGFAGRALTTAGKAAAIGSKVGLGLSLGGNFGANAMDIYNTTKTNDVNKEREAQGLDPVYNTLNDTSFDPVAAGQVAEASPLLAATSVMDTALDKARIFGVTKGKSLMGETKGLLNRFKGQAADGATDIEKAWADSGKKTFFKNAMDITGNAALTGAAEGFQEGLEQGVQDYFSSDEAVNNSMLQNYTSPFREGSDWLYNPFNATNSEQNAAVAAGVGAGITGGVGGAMRRGYNALAHGNDPYSDAMKDDNGGLITSQNYTTPAGTITIDDSRGISSGMDAAIRNDITNGRFNNEDGTFNEEGFKKTYRGNISFGPTIEDGTAPQPTQDETQAEDTPDVVNAAAEDGGKTVATQQAEEAATPETPPAQIDTGTNDTGNTQATTGTVPTPSIQNAFVVPAPNDTSKPIALPTGNMKTDPRMTNMQTLTPSNVVNDNATPIDVNVQDQANPMVNEAPVADINPVQQTANPTFIQNENFRPKKAKLRETEEANRKQIDQLREQRRQAQQQIQQAEEAQKKGVNMQATKQKAQAQKQLKQARDKEVELGSKQLQENMRRGIKNSTADNKKLKDMNGRQANSYRAMALGLMNNGAEYHIPVREKGTTQQKDQGYYKDIISRAMKGEDVDDTAIVKSILSNAKPEAYQSFYEKHMLNDDNITNRYLGQFQKPETAPTMGNLNTPTPETPQEAQQTPNNYQPLNSSGYNPQIRGNEAENRNVIPFKREEPVQSQPAQEKPSAPKKTKEQISDDISKADDKVVALKNELATQDEDTVVDALDTMAQRANKRQTKEAKRLKATPIKKGEPTPDYPEYTHTVDNIKAIEEKRGKPVIHFEYTKSGRQIMYLDGKDAPVVVYDPNLTIDDLRERFKLPRNIWLEQLPLDDHMAGVLTRQQELLQWGVKGFKIVKFDTAPGRRWLIFDPGNNFKAMESDPSRRHEGYKEKRAWRWSYPTNLNENGKAAVRGPRKRELINLISLGIIKPVLHKDGHVSFKYVPLKGYGRTAYASSQIYSGVSHRLLSKDLANRVAEFEDILGKPWDEVTKDDVTRARQEMIRRHPDLKDTYKDLAQIADFAAELTNSDDINDQVPEGTNIKQFTVGGKTFSSDDDVSSMSTQEFNDYIKLPAGYVSDVTILPQTTYDRKAYKLWENRPTMYKVYQKVRSTLFNGGKDLKNQKVQNSADASALVYSIVLDNMSRVSGISPEKLFKDSAISIGGEIHQGSLNQFAGEKGALNLRLINPNSTRTHSLTVAKDMYKKGIDKRRIWKETGWTRALDGQWRFEIPDYTDNIKFGKTHEIKTVGETYRNPELYRAYPQLKNWKVRFNSHLGPKDAALTDFNSKTIELNPNDRTLKTSFLHEIQHVIQAEENFGMGGAPETVLDQVIKEHASIQNSLQRILGNEDSANKVLGYYGLKRSLSYYKGTPEEQRINNSLKPIDIDRIIPTDKRGIVENLVKRTLPIIDAIKAKELSGVMNNRIESWEERAYQNLLGEQESRTTEYRAITNDRISYPEYADNDNAIVVFNQGKDDDIAGQYTPEGNIISVFAKADESTFAHESAHMYYDFMVRHQKDSPYYREQLKKADDWLSYSPEKVNEYKDAVRKEFAGYAKKIEEAKTPKEKAEAIYRWKQERFARGFERYLQEGKAPNSGLQRLFDQFKQWLKDIYQAVKVGNLAPISPEMKKVYDNMFQLPAGTQRREQTARREAKKAPKPPLNTQNQGVEEPPSHITLTQKATPSETAVRGDFSENTPSNKAINTMESDPEVAETRRAEVAGAQSIIPTRLKDMYNAIDEAVGGGIEVSDARQFKDNSSIKTRFMNTLTYRMTRLGLPKVWQDKLNRIIEKAQTAQAVRSALSNKYGVPLMNALEKYLDGNKKQKEERRQRANDIMNTVSDAGRDYAAYKNILSTDDRKTKKRILVTMDDQYKDHLTKTEAEAQIDEFKRDGYTNVHMYVDEESPTEYVAVAWKDKNYQPEPWNHPDDKNGNSMKLYREKSYKIAREQMKKHGYKDGKGKKQQIDNAAADFYIDMRRQLDATFDEARRTFDNALQTEFNNRNILAIKEDMKGLDGIKLDRPHYKLGWVPNETKPLAIMMVPVENKPGDWTAPKDSPAGQVLNTFDNGKDLKAWAKEHESMLYGTDKNGKKVRLYKFVQNPTGNFFGISAKSIKKMITGLGVPSDEAERLIREQIAREGDQLLTDPAQYVGSMNSDISQFIDSCTNEDGKVDRDKFFKLLTDTFNKPAPQVAKDYGFKLGTYAINQMREYADKHGKKLITNNPMELKLSFAKVISQAFSKNMKKAREDSAKRFASKDRVGSLIPSFEKRINNIALYPAYLPLQVFKSELLGEDRKTDGSNKISNDIVDLINALGDSLMGRRPYADKILTAAARNINDHGGLFGKFMRKQFGEDWVNESALLGQGVQSQLMLGGITNVGFGFTQLTQFFSIAAYAGWGPTMRMIGKFLKKNNWTSDQIKEMTQEGKYNTNFLKNEADPALKILNERRKAKGLEPLPTGEDSVVVRAYQTATANNLGSVDSKLPDAWSEKVKNGFRTIGRLNMMWVKFGDVVPKQVAIGIKWDQIQKKIKEDKTYNPSEEEIFTELTNWTNKTCWSYANTSVPKWYGDLGNFGKLMFPFAKFGFLQMDMFHNLWMDRKFATIGQYIGAYSMLGGVIAGIPMANLLAAPLAWAAGESSVDDWWKKSMLRWFGGTSLQDLGKVLAYGLPSLVGIDLSSKVGLNSLFENYNLLDKDSNLFPLVQKTRGIFAGLGAVGSAWSGTGDVDMNAATYAMLKNVLPKSAVDTLFEVGSLAGLGTTSHVNATKNQDLAPFSVGGSAARIFGVRPVSDSIDSAVQRMITEDNQEYSSKRKELMIKFINGTPQEKAEMAPQLKEYGITKKDIKQAANRREDRKGKNRADAAAGKVTKQNNEAANANRQSAQNLLSYTDSNLTP